MQSCPHCQEPLVAVAIFRSIDDTELWERQADGSWLRTDHNAACRDLEQRCHHCGTVVSSDPTPGTLAPWFLEQP